MRNIYILYYVYPHYFCIQIKGGLHVIIFHSLWRVKIKLLFIILCNSGKEASVPLWSRVTKSIVWPMICCVFWNKNDYTNVNCFYCYWHWQYYYGNKKKQQTVYVSNLFSSGIWFFLFQLMIISVAFIVLHDVLMKYQRIGLYSDVHSHTPYFLWWFRIKPAIISSAKPNNKYSCSCRAVVSHVSKG